MLNVIKNDDNNSIDNHLHFMEQAFNKHNPSSERKCIWTKEIELRASQCKGPQRGRLTKQIKYLCK